MAFESLGSGNYETTRLRINEKGQDFQGYYIATGTFEHDGETYRKQVFKNDDGEVIEVTGGSVMHDELAKIEKHIGFGYLVRVECVGKPQGKRYFGYKVTFDKSVKLEA